MLPDLHTHTTCSDGKLSPTELVWRAQQAGVTMLAITDHDAISAYEQIDASAFKLQIIAGVEFSTQWQGYTIHIVGLNIDLNSETIKAAIALQQSARDERAFRIAERLEKLGAHNVLEGTRQIAQDAGLSRPHFAQYLVDSGFCDSHKTAFKRYLGAGKIGDIKHLWAELDLVVEWIRAANGIATLAHPGHYRLTRTKSIALVDRFQSAGGQAIEVLSGQQSPEATTFFADVAAEKKLFASMGSDFHSPDMSWVQLGMHKVLPKRCCPVWDEFS